MSSTNGNGYETFLMGTLLHSFLSKALSTCIGVSERPTWTNVGLGKWLICLNMAFDFNIDVKYLDKEPHWNNKTLYAHNCKSRIPLPLI